MSGARVLLYSGKGGVGKTSLSGATAALTARHGRRTLVVSTDSAHSLSDALEVEVGPEPTRVAQNLDALEIDVNRELSRHWGAIHDWLTRFMTFKGVADVVAEELAVLPGMEELFSLLRVKSYAEQRAYDVVIVDCAPTGETVRMLSVPEILEFYFTRIFPVQRTVVRSVRPLARRLTDLPLPGDDVFAAVQQLYGQMQGMGALLQDARHASIRLVLNPERMVVRESQRLYTYLSLFGFPVDAVIANRVLPQEARAPWFDRWFEIQAAHLREARELFDPLPFLEARLLGQELVGLARLEELGREVFGERDPSAVLYQERPIQVKREGRDYALWIHLPFARKERLSVFTRGDDLVVLVDNQRRHVALPRTLLSRAVHSAAFEGQHLKVVFGRKERHEES